MKQPTQAEFDTAKDVLEFMHDSMEKHEPYAVNSISTTRECLDCHSFQADDYME